MNVSIYLFGKLGGDYTQYPDDYALDIFSAFENNIKSPSQLMIHRYDALIYYGYLRRLSDPEKYIGIGLVFNGVMCTDITALCKLCEDNITNWVLSGDILEFADNGDIISKVDKLYNSVSDFQNLSKKLSSQIVNSKLPFSKLPPINYSVPEDAVSIFSIKDDNDKINQALLQCCNIYIYSDSTSNTLAGYADKLRRLYKENNELKNGSVNNDESKNKPPKPPVRITRSLVIMITAITICMIAIAAFIFIHKIYKEEQQHRNTIQKEYDLLVDRCNQFILDGDCDGARNVIDDMIKMETENTWIMVKSKSCSHIVDKKCK